MRNYLYIFCTLVVFGSCTKDRTAPQESSKVPCTAVDFQTEVFALIVNNCATSGCHNSNDLANGFALTSYAEIAAVAEDPQFLRAIEHNPQAVAMPISASKLPQKDIATIRCWIENGREE